MTDEKPWYESKTVWGGLITVAAAAASSAHYTISPADQAHLIELIMGGISTVGGILSIYGRIKATHKIKGA